MIRLLELSQNEIAPPLTKIRSPPAPPSLVVIVTPPVPCDTTAARIAMLRLASSVSRFALAQVTGAMTWISVRCCP